MSPPLARRLLAGYLGSAFLAALVIGSGIAPAFVPGFVIAQLAGGIMAFALIRTVRPGGG